jgi:hypothetical protein
VFLIRVDSVSHSSRQCFSFEYTVWPHGEFTSNLKEQELAVTRTKSKRRNLTLASSLEEHSHDKDLQKSHSNHHQTLNDEIIKDSLLGAPDGRKVSILTSAKVFLLARNGAELATELEDGVLQSGRLLEVGALLGRDTGSAWLVFNRDFKVNHLVGKGADAVVKAESVFARLCRCKDKVALALFAAIEDDSFFAGFCRGAVD